jgi:hypothetical protein
VGFANAWQEHRYPHSRKSGLVLQEAQVGKGGRNP